MPTTLATRWRQRDSAIARKASQLIEPWDDEEDMTPEPNTLKPEPPSPVSVASVLDAELKPLDAEMKPFVLPGAWVVVGKRGKPTLSSKMYDEPAATTTTKPKKKKKSKAPVGEAPPLVVTLEEAPSSSKCLRALDHSTAQRAKVVTSAKEAKHWAAYQRAKQQKREALHELVAALALGDDETDAAAPAKKSNKNNKANSSKDKARRRARSAAAAARCLLPDEDEGALVGRAEAAPEPSKLVVAPAFNDTAATAVKLPGAWQLVGKRGKALSDFPPLKPSDKDDARAPRKTDRPQKRVSSPKAKSAESHEESPAKAVKRDSAKRDKALQCSVM